MNIPSTLAAILALGLVAWGCPGPANKKGNSDAGVDAGVDAGSTLTVKNYLSWCSVSIADGGASTAAAQTVAVTPGIVDLAAMPASSSFILGLWHHTTGDTGSGDPGAVTGSTSVATVDAGVGSTCVWVCCPFTNGTGCPTADQCP